MTNAQKAHEIAKVHEVHYDIIHGETSKDECFLSALEMAWWKEQQMIEKACEWLEENIGKYEDIYYEVGGYVSPEFRTEECIKDFRKAMEG